MTDNTPETKTEEKQPGIRKRPSLFGIVFLYLMGFFIIRKSEYDSTTILGIAMLIFGWICILLSMMLSVLVLFRLFKEFSKKK